MKKFVRTAGMVAAMAGTIGLSTGMASAAPTAVTAGLKGTTFAVDGTWTGVGSFTTTWSFTRATSGFDTGCTKPCRFSYKVSRRSFTLEYLPTKHYNCDATYTGTLNAAKTAISGTMTTDGNPGCITTGGTFTASKN